MPCTYDESPAEISAREQVEIDNAVKPYKANLDLVTRVACNLMHLVLTKLAECLSNGDVELDEEVVEWWTAHQKADRESAARERLQVQKKVDIANLIRSHLSPDLTWNDVKSLIEKEDSIPKISATAELAPSLSHSPVVITGIEDKDRRVYLQRWSTSKWTYYIHEALQFDSREEGAQLIQELMKGTDIFVRYHVGAISLLTATPRLIAASKKAQMFHQPRYLIRCTLTNAPLSSSKFRYLMAEKDSSFNLMWTEQVHLAAVFPVDDAGALVAKYKWIFHEVSMIKSRRRRP